LPANNFTVSSSGPACVGLTDGMVTITAASNYAYQVNFTNNEGLNLIENFTQQIQLTNVPPGDYQACITVQGQAEYQQCFNIAVAAPKMLTVISSLDPSGKNITLDLEGGQFYEITLNGKKYSTTEPTITLPLDSDYAKLSVRTDKECQGTFEEDISLEGALKIYPNPVSDGSLLHIQSEGHHPNEQYTLSLYDSSGHLVKTEKIFGQTLNTFNMDGLPKGLYLLTLETPKKSYNFKILKNER
jgi:hypothetical protein